MDRRGLRTSLTLVWMAVGVNFAGHMEALRVNIEQQTSLV